MTKKVIRHFGGWKSKKFLAKGKIFHGVRNFFWKYGGNLKQGGKCIIASEGGWTPLPLR